jgi:probable F420-dependent oxidoreductase
MSTNLPLTTTGPDLSTTLPTFAAEDPGSWQYLFDRIRAADASGVDRVVVSDHVVYGENLDAYSKPELGGVAGGKQPTGPDGHWLEPLTVLSIASGMTTRVRLGTNILIAALRRPVVLAKSTSTLDVLSGGRLDLGVGVGWQREEYTAAGLDFDGRGRLLDHTLEVLQTLWREQRAQYSSNELSFDAIHMQPKPVQPTGVPVWVSGTINARMLSRLTRFGSGWIPWGASASALASSVEQVREALEAAGRDPKAIGIVANLPTVRGDDGKPDVDRTLAGAPALIAAGGTDIRFNLPIPSGLNAATDYLSDVVQRYRAVVA